MNLVYSMLLRRIFDACGRPQGWLAFGAACVLILGSGSIAAQQSNPRANLSSDPQATQQSITPNFKDTDLAQIVEAVSAVTHKTFIIDPRVKANVTVLSSTPMSPAAFYEVFLAILQVHGFIAVPSGNTIKIVPDANLRQVPGDDLPDHVSSSSDEIVTQVVAIKNVSAAQLVPTLRPLMPQTGHMAAYAGGNILILSDHANNVNRMMRIIERIDQASDDSIDVIPLENASATEIMRVINALNTGAAQPDAAALSVKVIADERSNSILITGEKAQRLRMKALIANLDTPLKTGTGTEVRYLYYADAEKLAAKLKEQIQGLTAAATGATNSATASAADRSVSIWADPQANALVVTAPPKVMRQIMSIVDKLDFRKPQVKVEAILVEMSFEKSSEFGFNWIVGPSSSNSGTVPIGIFNQSVGGTNIGTIAAAVLGIQQGDSTTTTTNGTVSTTTSGNPALSTVAGAIPTGVTLGGGRISSSGINFVTLLRALQGDGHTNIISTPTIITLDNEEAKIEVAQEVPFITGQYASTGSGGATTPGSTGGVNPFQTIQRQKVGTILKITPQINEGDAVMLKIDQEASSLAQGTQGAVDLITNTRKITTKVLVDDGGLIVLGGLTSESLTEGQNGVPWLQSIPLLGNLFKTRNVDKKKNNLMIFIHPVILRDGVQTAIETNARYNSIRDEQRSYKKGKVTLLPGEKQPSLPSLEDVTRFVNPQDAADKTPITDTRRRKREEPASESKPVTPPATTTEPPAAPAPSTATDAPAAAPTPTNGSANQSR